MGRIVPELNACHDVPGRNIRIAVGVLEGNVYDFYCTQFDGGGHGDSVSLSKFKLVHL